MANEVEQILIKVGLDTSKFNQSLKGLTYELRTLQNVDLNILSEKERQVILMRMASIKDTLQVMRREMEAASDTEIFANMSALAGPLVATLGALGTSMEMFGVKSEDVAEIQNKLLGIVSVLGSIQTIVDANRLKGLLRQIPLQMVEAKQRLINNLLIKTETAAVVADTAAKEVQAATVIKLTWLQKLWNKAVLANPIAFVIAAVVLLGTAIWGLTKALSDNTESFKENEKSIDGMVVKNQELREMRNKMIQDERDYQLELQKTLKLITDESYDKKKILNEQLKANEDAFKKMNENLTAQAEKTGDINVEFLRKFVNELPKIIDEQNQIITFGETKSQKERLEYFTEGQLAMIEIIKAYDAEKIKNQLETNNKLNLINKKYLMDSTELIKTIQDETEGLKLTGMERELYDLKLWFNKTLTEYKLHYDKLGELIPALVANYNEKEKLIRLKYQADMIKYSEEYYKKLLEMYRKSEADLKEINDPTTELEALSELNYKLIQENDKLYNTKKINLETYLKSQKILEMKYANEIEISTLNSETEKNKKILDIQKEFLNQSINQKREADLKLVDENKNGKNSPEEIAKLKLDINRKYDKMIFDYQKEIGAVSWQDELQLLYLQLDERAALEQLNEQQIADAKFNIKRQYDMDYIRAEELRIEAENTMRQAQAEILNTIVSGMFQIMSENQSIYYQNELNKIQEVYDAKTKSIDDQLKYGIISEEEANTLKDQNDKKRSAKEAAVKRKQFKAEQALAVAEIGIQTAIGIMKLYAQLGMAASIATPWLVGLGLTQAALVMAKPMPQFKDGSREPFNPDGKTSGVALLHKNEMVINAAGVSAMGSENIRRLNQNPSSFLNSKNISYTEMVEYIDLSFSRYNNIPVIIKENILTESQTKVRNVKANSEIM